MSWKKRQSGIELIKIIAMFMIVTSHIVQCIGETQIDITSATRSPSVYWLTYFFHFGVWGNSIFFICSAWFLLDSTRFNKKKWLFLLIEAWTVSVIFLIVTAFLRKGDIPADIILRSLLPTTFGNTWYITCYLLFYPLHPFLNQLIGGMKQETLLRTTLALSFLYLILYIFFRDSFFGSNLMIWIAIYFIMAYLKKYRMDFMNSIGKNLLLLIGGFAGFSICLTVMEVVGLRFSFLNGKMLYLSRINNPFMIMMSVAMLNLVRRWNFHNAVVNYLSGLSLLIYLAQSNLCVKTYWRPYLVQYVFDHYAAISVISRLYLISGIVFAACVLFGILYNLIVAPGARSLSAVLYQKIGGAYLKWEKKRIG